MPKSSELIAFVPAQPEGLPSPFKSVSAGGLMAVFAPYTGGVFRSRRAMLRGAQERQRHLERLMGLATVLPVLPGARLGPKDIAAAVTANGPDLAARLDALHGKQQYQLTVSLQEGAALAPRFASQAALVETLEARIEAAVLALVDEHLALPVAARALTNHVLLIDEAAAPGLDAALEAVDALWTEGLRLKLIGPSPAVSFCSLGFRQIAPRAVNQAFALLGLAPGAPGEAVQPALRLALRAGRSEPSPDMLRAAARLCEKAARRQDQTGPLWEAFFWSEGRAQSDLHTPRKVA